MDLKITGPGPTAAERAAVDRVLGPEVAASPRTETSGHAARADRHLLLPVLHAIQDHVGWISHGALGYACQRLTVPPAEAYGVASFYSLLDTAPAPPNVAHLCDDVVCRMHGAESRCADLTAALGPEGHPPAGQTTTWHRSPCLGHCERGPVALVVRAGERPAAATLPAATSTDIVQALGGHLPPARGLEEARTVVPEAGSPSHRLLARIGSVDPHDYQGWLARGGLAGLRRALTIGPAATLTEVSTSGLSGRGGAAFPTGRKWAAVAAAPARPHYLVCNADESETGTFKDRVLLEWDPLAILEGLAIAAFAIGAEKAWIYLRAEYPLARARLEAAMTLARTAGWIGPSAFGPGRPFEIELRRGAGAYICGEETALFNSIEGKRGEPRSKPPFPTDVGLFGAPTVVNNVETIANVPLILAEGAASYLGRGTKGSPGTKLFCVSGSVRRPGLYERDFGLTLRELIALTGGVPEGRTLRTVLLGGAAGTFVGPEALDVPLASESLRPIGASLGSGAVMIVDDQADFPALLRRIAQFFRDESCGQCVPCRVGTVRQEESLARLKNGGSPAAELPILADLAAVMKDASICGLGHTASAAVMSGLALLAREKST